ncbi:WD repeat-containing protein mio [Operophtera brumata]|uniref:WD repeat-containing protein mio n=1 Tax=Operophtera brumata TaxID=104452 RepID=A0A0L7KN43_OPEBR|nr:WD repeat-containing protein mio [Operophtera brumata]
MFLDWSNKAVNTTSSRYCYGACADPFNPWQLASRADNVACIWDARALHSPLLTLQHQRPLAGMQWCPTRRNLLLTLQRDSSSIRLHDIQQANDNDSKNSSASNDAVRLSVCRVRFKLASSWQFHE